MSIGFVIDLDGVVFKRDVKGYNMINGSMEALEILRTHSIPHVFLSNGTSQLESEKAATLNKLLGSEVYNYNDFVLASTPFASLAQNFQDKRVLIVSKSTEECTKFAKAHNWLKYISVQDYSRCYPYLWPGTKKPLVAQHGNEGIHAVLIYSEPQDWAEAIQIICDVSRFNGHLGNDACCQAIPIFVSNPDLVYAAQHCIPRITLGTFAEFCKVAYKNYTGQDLEIEYFGKPFAPIYKECKERLEKQNVKGPIYAVGDNPSSDIKGANAAGQEWVSILVKTGVYQGSEAPTYKPIKTCQNLLEAVESIITQI